ncbi:MAG: DNA primase, partial [Synergistaceae bacterium]|nr:DNA primase [Synergistaceae bacterium]
MNDDAHEVKNRLDIAEVIGDYVSLRRAGGSLKGLCPFHGEKTASFHVSPERQSFHCFGCGKGGDIFSFIMEIEGLSFREALERLSARAGVKLSSRPAAGGRRENPRAILDEADAFFRSSLLEGGGTAARSYLDRRKLKPDAWTRFGFGWGPESWDALSKHLKTSGRSDAEIVASGLVSEGGRG